MILPNVRASFGPTEVGALLRCLAADTGQPEVGFERTLQEEGLDALLDAPATLPALMAARGLAAVPASLAFYVLARRSLLDAGVSDRRIADYIAALLSEFGERDRAFRVARYDDKAYDSLVDLVADLDQAAAQRKFLLCAHLGNFALWLAGLFPDHITARVHRKGAPGLGYYEDLGAFGYRSAAEFEWASALDLADLYRDAADLFRSPPTPPTASCGRWPTNSDGIDDGDRRRRLKGCAAPTGFANTRSKKT